MERLDGVTDGVTSGHTEFDELRTLTLHLTVKLRDSQSNPSCTKLCSYGAALELNLYLSCHSTE